MHLMLVRRSFSRELIITTTDGSLIFDRLSIYMFHLRRLQSPIFLYFLATIGPKFGTLKT